MKIINLHSVSPSLDIDIHPDSTVVLSGRPLFLPEEGEGMVAHGHIAVRISRLGKNISEKFAPRYYDAVTIMLRVVPAEGVPAQMTGVYSAMDATSVMGEWQDVSMTAQPLSVTLDGAVTELGPVAKAVDSAIHEISRYMTLKIGDVLMLPTFGVSSQLRAGTHLTAEIDGMSVVDMKIV